jgi:hypothetical protein
MASDDGVMRREEAPTRQARPGAPARVRYFVLPELLLGGVVAEVPLLEVLGLVDGEVVELEPDDVSDERVDGEADGLVDGVPPTRSLSVRLQASVIPPTSARAQRADSNFFIADSPPCGVCVRPGTVGCNRYARGGTMRPRVYPIDQRRFAV